MSGTTPASLSGSSDICTYAVYKEFERKIKLSNVDVKFKLTFDYIKTMYGYKTLFGVEPLEMDEIQKQIYDAIYSKWKFGCPMRNSGVYW